MSVPSVIRLGGLSPRSHLLMAAVDLLVEDARVERHAISRVAVTRGPGSFTGIRSGLATAAGLSAALGSAVYACDSLPAQAMRVGAEGEVWAAQPGRRGEVYARRYRVGRDCLPRPLSDLQIMAIDELKSFGSWIAAEGMDLGPASRVDAVRSTAEAVIRMMEFGPPECPLEPLYVEGPPIHGGRSAG